MYWCTGVPVCRYIALCVCQCVWAKGAKSEQKCASKVQQAKCNAIREIRRKWDSSWDYKERQHDERQFPEVLPPAGHHPGITLPDEGWVERLGVWESLNLRTEQLSVADCFAWIMESSRNKRRIRFTALLNLYYINYGKRFTLHFYECFALSHFTFSICLSLLLCHNECSLLI